MLGVLKRRWKPKRSSTSTRIPGSETASLEGFDRDKRPHQVHPLAETRQTTLICYEKPPPPPPVDATSTSPPSSTCYPLAPNICVEAGRIQFVKREESNQCEGNSRICLAPGRITVTRGLQTEFEDDDDDGLKEIQVFLENRIADLEAALESAQKNELRDRQTINKLTRQLNRRETAQRDAERERRLRADSESRTKQALQEAARCRSRLKLLTSEFQRMEETVRGMLVYKKQADQLKQEKAALTLAFENRCQQYQSTISRLNVEITTLKQQLEQTTKESDPETTFRLALQRQAEESRKQYEKCLDDVASQVVRALLAQKGLREEVGFLNGKINDLENQNRALASMLVHKLRAESSSMASPLEWEETILSQKDNNHKNNASTPVQFVPHPQSSLNIKHCNSFNSEILETSPGSEKRLSADTASILDTRLSYEDKKRHQVLTKLWTELKGAEVTPKKLLEALSAVDSALWVPPKRPVSLNLHLPILPTAKYRRSRPVLASASKSEEETTGNESPESGNRDEGYSTMSSDVQTDATRGSGDATLPRRGLEDLKEATDETDVSDNRLLVTDNKDPDILYIPLNLLQLNQRNSFPPSKDILPFQHIMRSFSDSHLCIKITTAPSPCYTFTSPLSSNSSIFLVDITEKTINPLRRTRGTSTLWGNANFEICAEEASPWSSAEDNLNWDAEYIQHWLRVDEARSAIQQQNRDMLELEYDRTELEDWSLSLSNDENWKKFEIVTTPGQISLSTTLPSIQENNALELEEDSNECLWNDSSYMVDKEGREIVTLLMDAQSDKRNWPYAIPNITQQNNSPDNSWSSNSDCCNSHEPETCSKRSSVASSDGTGEIPAVGTDFTRDFYRLVKFESTKSLASTSSRSIGGDNPERDTAFQNVLTFIAEQQKYSTPEITKEFNIEGPKPEEEPSPKVDDENYVTLKQLCEEFSCKKLSCDELRLVDEKIKHAEEICLVTPIDVEVENCSNITERPVDICSSVNVELDSPQEETTKIMSDSTETVQVSRIPRRKTPSRIPVSPARSVAVHNNNNNNLSNNNNGKDGKETLQESRLPRSKIPHKSNKVKLKKVITVEQTPQSPQHPVITSEKLPQSTSGVLSHIIEGPPHRAVSFHERATSKDVIDELNRMIKSGDEQDKEEEKNKSGGGKLDQDCKTTGWVHVEKDIDLTDPKARANLLDVMMASVSSDSSPTSSCGGSVASDSTEDPPNYEHLHRIHKYHRQKKANAVRPEMAVVRASAPQHRPPIVGRTDFFVRYGEKEREAVASFDFLDELSTASGSQEELV